MLEPRPGVFVGKLSRRVRELLWEKTCRHVGAGGCMLLQVQNNEQRFTMEMAGECRRTIVNLDGLYLVRVPEDVKLPATPKAKSEFPPLQSSSQGKQILPEIIPESGPLCPQPASLVPSQSSSDPPRIRYRVQKPTGSDLPRPVTPVQPATPEYLVPDFTLSPLPLSVPLIQVMAGFSSFTRGDAYQQAGKVRAGTLDLERCVLRGQVAGTSLYDVEVALMKNLLSGTCSCPVRRNCKHCAALCLEWVRNPGAFTVLPGDAPSR